MQLTFVHDCPPKDSLGEDTGCPIFDREIKVSSTASTWTIMDGRLNEYVVPDVRCIHTNNQLRLVAVDGNRNI